MFTEALFFMITCTLRKRRSGIDVMKNLSWPGTPYGKVKKNPNDTRSYAFVVQNSCTVESHKFEAPARE